MKKFPLLDIVDFSADFMLPGSVLYVPGAEKTVKPAKYFLSNTRFSYALLKNDTHFEGEYEHSVESGPFEFHQGFGTKGHQYQLSLDHVNALEKYWMLKNAFDMWGSADIGIPFDEIKFHSNEERRAYLGLFHIAIQNKKGMYFFGEHRDSFISRVQKSGVNEVVVFGHATDYCVRDAMLGYLARGFKVILIEDLCRGIWDTSLLGGVSNLDELIEHCPLVDYVNGTVMHRSVFKDALTNGNLTVTTSKKFIKDNPEMGCLNKIEKLAKKNKIR
tara:strand:- start:135604 stop:136425 length:822 start_codon:yes stop_codon:yes gene_type:complete